MIFLLTVYDWMLSAFGWCQHDVLHAAIVALTLQGIITEHRFQAEIGAGPGLGLSNLDIGSFLNNPQLVNMVRMWLECSRPFVVMGTGDECVVCLLLDAVH